MTQFSLPPLAYDFEELEPVISKEILEIHYSKHHAGYVQKLNEAVEKLENVKGHASEMVALLPQILFHGGGHINHTLFWENLIGEQNGGGELKEGPLKDAIEKEFTSFSHFVELFTAKAAVVQGSGWAFLVYDKELKRLEIITTQNHELVSSKKASYIPLLCIDVWEHAYYLQYKNDRLSFLKNIWKIINFGCVQTRLAQEQ